MLARRPQRRRRDPWNPRVSGTFILSSILAVIVGVSLSVYGRKVMDDDSREQTAYQTISRINEIRASLHTSEAKMRAFLMSGNPSDQKAYEVAWQVTDGGTERLESVTKDDSTIKALYADLHAMQRAMDVVVETRQTGDYRTSARLANNPIFSGGATDRDLDQLIAWQNIGLVTYQRERQDDFLFTEVLFIATMVAGTLSVFLAMYGTGRELTKQPEQPLIVDESLEIDEATGLLSRSSFEIVLEQELEKSAKKKAPLTLLLLELDQLPNVRERKGERVYNAALRSTSSVLNDVFRTSDICARFSDTEFAIILRNTNLESSRIPAERARVAVQSNEWPDCYLTANLGAAEADSGEEKDSLICRAQQAVEYARRTGRNRVSLTQAYASLAA